MAPILNLVKTKSLFIKKYENIPFVTVFLFLQKTRSHSTQKRQDSDPDPRSKHRRRIDTYPCRVESGSATEGENSLWREWGKKGKGGGGVEEGRPAADSPLIGGSNQIRGENITNQKKTFCVSLLDRELFLGSSWLMYYLGCDVARS
jgi:hypothetical protein